MQISERLHLYRVSDHLTSDGVMLNVRTYVAIKETECGYWVSLKSSAYTLKECGGWIDWKRAKELKHIRWVAKDSERSHCYTDLKKALKSYIKRKESQELRARTSLETAELALAQRARIMALTTDDFAAQRYEMVRLGEIESLYRYNFE